MIAERFKLISVKEKPKSNWRVNKKQTNKVIVERDNSIIPKM